jgi:tetratricopeptide (TPR) repeat protein
MNQKIEWYKEVLALEPGSKVFFPLARLQAENGLPGEALATLRHGISRNPEHIEARLLLIDILFASGQFDALWPELDQVALMLGGYPGFWSAWNERLARNPSSRDASLALSFFSAALRGEAVSWSDIIEQGLRNVLPAGDGGPVKSPSRVTPAALDELKTFLKDSPSVSEKPAPAVVRSAVKEMPAKPAEPDSAANLPPSAGRPLDFSELRAPAENFDNGEPKTFDKDDENEPEDEVFSLKTRSMAEVLAEQGDYAGALDIYEELMRESKSEEEKKSLEGAIANIRTRAGDSVNQTQASRKNEGDDEDNEPAGQGKNRLLSVLDALARRLEARS